MSKKDEILKLYDEYKNTFKDKEFVPGEGNENAHLVLVGEAPGKDEVKLSRPFVGMAGKNLDEFLSIIGVERQDIYITNAIKYRLSKVNSETGRVSNRPATTDEIKSSREYLLKEMELIKPSIIVTLGNVPLRSVIGSQNDGIGAVHGKIMPLIINGNEYRLYPLYHPASIIYNRSLKDTYVADVKNLGEILRGGL